MDDKYLDFIIGIEKKLTNLIKELKALEAISEIDYKKLKSKGSTFGVLYGFRKTHIKVLDKCSAFRPVLSIIKTPSCNLTKFLVPLIEAITRNILKLKILLNYLRNYVDKIQNTLWSVLMLSPFSPIYHWGKPLKLVVTHFIRIKNCCLTSAEISLRNF